MEIMQEYFFFLNALLGDVNASIFSPLIITTIQGPTEEELTGEPFFELWSGGHVHSALAVTVQQCGISPVAQQQRTNLHSVLGCCFMERSELPQIHGINTSSMLEREKAVRAQSMRTKHSDHSQNT